MTGKRSAVNGRSLSPACVIFLGVLLTARSVVADDRFDVGLLLGATTASNEGSLLQFDRALTYQATFGWRFSAGDNVAWSFEVPFLA